MTALPYQEIINHLPVGVLIIDETRRVCFWNAWLANHTSIAGKEAAGRTLEELFPGHDNSRFAFALEQVLKTKSPQIMSQALNRYLIPIRIPNMERHGISMMQQTVTLEHLADDGGRGYALVSIMNVTENVVRSAALTELAHKLQHDSNRDHLTMLYNRRFMWEWLVQQIKQSNRHDHQVACLMLDLDNFKSINDRYGHKEGDAVLRGFAGIVDEHLRKSDILVRYGGEEFVVLMPQCDIEAAIAAAWRTVRGVREAAIGSLAPGQVTCSIGISVYDPGNPRTGEELLKEADKRLYEAKNSGKDQVVPGSA